MSDRSKILALPEMRYDEDEEKLKKDEKVKLEKLGGFFNPTETPEKPEEGEVEYEEEKGEEYGKLKKKKEDDEEEYEGGKGDLPLLSSQMADQMYGRLRETAREGRNKTEKKKLYRADGIRG